jgi:hypothetical protein
MMSESNIVVTDEAVEAAAQAIWQVRPLTRENIRAATKRALKAASSHMYAASDEDNQFFEQGKL